MSGGVDTGMEVVQYSPVEPECAPASVIATTPCAQRLTSSICSAEAAKCAESCLASIVISACLGRSLSTVSGKSPLWRHLAFRRHHTF